MMPSAGKPVPEEPGTAGTAGELWNERLDLLRRGLVRSSLAAEGSDKAVDQCMQELRELIRGEQMDNRTSRR